LTISWFIEGITWALVCSQSCQVNRFGVVKPTQTLMFPDAKPLVERLGRDFFRQLPARPGVYLMRDRAEAIVYVGKAKNLRQRLGSYRVANPDRVPKRLLRLLKSVERIELEECADEAAALAREAELLLELKPRFNRAGVWSAPPKVLAWRRAGEGIELGVLNAAETGWEHHGPLRGGSGVMFTCLVRLLWALAYPERGLTGMPAGWFHGHLPERVELLGQGEVVATWIAGLTCGQGSELITAELPTKLAESYTGGQFTLLSEDLERLVNYFRPLPASFTKGIPVF
jgi:predicted GIY-YIG superfamily endonuclease